MNDKNGFLMGPEEVHRWFNRLQDLMIRDVQYVGVYGGGQASAKENYLMGSAVVFNRRRKRARRELRRELRLRHRN